MFPLEFSDLPDLPLDRSLLGGDAPLGGDLLFLLFLLGEIDSDLL